MSTADEGHDERFEPSAESLARWEAYRALKRRRGEPDPDMAERPGLDDDPAETDFGEAEFAEVAIVEAEPAPAPRQAAPPPDAIASVPADLPPLVQRLPRDRAPAMAGLVAWPIAAMVGFIGGLMAMNAAPPSAANHPVKATVASAPSSGTMVALATLAPGPISAAGGLAGDAPTSAASTPEPVVQPLANAARTAPAHVPAVRQRAKVQLAEASLAPIAPSAVRAKARHHVRHARARDTDAEDWVRYGYMSH